MDSSSITSTLAKSSDGSVQITYQIPKEVVGVSKKKVIAEEAKKAELPGFRKGKAPFDLVEKNISEEKLVEETLEHLLPAAFSESIKKYSLAPAIIPKFRVLATPTDSTWQVTAETCEIPPFDLGDYKKAIRGALASEKKELTAHEKEEIVIQTLLSAIRGSVPKMLITAEVERKLASLISKLEKLAISLESYLTSLGKTPEKLRTDYEKEAEEAISLQLILDKIVAANGIKVEDSEVEAAISTAGATEANDKASLFVLVRAVLARRKALDSLVSIV